MPPAVALRHIHKRFGAVLANDDVNLIVAAGTVHGIVGENGAGKSTLMCILYGLMQADSGRIEIDGQPVQLRHSRQAIALGIGMVHQHFMLVETFTALDNLMLGAEPGWLLRPARAQVRKRLTLLMKETGLQVDLDAPVQTLPLSERQRLEILKALLRGARILILDEPTAVLTPDESLQLFATLRSLRASGTTVLLISHKLKEIMALCDQVSVMRAGRLVLDTAVADTSVDKLATAMVGQPVNLGRGPGSAQPGAVLLQAQGLTLQGPSGGQALRGVSVRLRAGEIVGVAGVSGNGQSALLEVLSGMTAPDEGQLHLAGQHFSAKAWLNPHRARQLRLAHVPEDRHRRGLVLPFAAWESALLGYQGRQRYQRWGWMKQRSVLQDTAQMMQRHDVRPPDPKGQCSQFSGGNQQKLVLAREFFNQPQVLLVGQPTRGVDIGAIQFIHGRLRALRDGGGAVLLVSSELDEILALADRVLVMQAGRVVGELAIEDCSVAALGRLMGGAGSLSATAPQDTPA